MEINPNTLEIEIVDVEPIDGGVQVFARAWSDGQQIGFGTDGTVDIERFRIFNPPILVEDPNSDIVQVTPANELLNRPEATRTLREDAETATLQSLAHTISQMRNVHNSSNIIVGKTGNTTSTFYPDPNPETTSCDGYVVTNITNPGEPWSTIRGRSAGTAASASTTNGYDTYIIHATTSNQFRYLGRSFFLFDTSVLPDSDNIDSATLSLFHFDAAIDNSPAQTYCISSSSPSSNTDLVTDDFDQVGSVSLANEIAGSAVTRNAYNTFTLNASGIANISKTGISKFAMRLKDDLDNTAPTWSSGAASGWYSVYADTAGTTQDPKLVVEHSSAGATTTPTLMMMGVGS